MRRNSVLEEMRVRSYAVMQEEIWVVLRIYTSYISAVSNLYFPF